MNGLEVVASTTDAAFAVNGRGRLVAWNEAAEKLFGHKASEVLGRHCWAVLGSRDVFGNEYCQKDCQLRRMALAGQPVHPCELVFSNAVGEPLRARVSLLALGPPGAPDTAFVHLLCPSSTEDQTQPILGWKLYANNASSRLTAREREVLALLADGKATQAIAEGLGLSPATVRNHIQNILHKLRVHSRLAAVALGRRLGLIC